MSAGPRAPVSVSYERARHIAERFIAWAQGVPGCELRVEFGIGFSYDIELPKLIDYISFRRDNDMGGWDYLPLNGLGLRTREELAHLLASLQSVGLRMANLSFYGTRESHDSFARRRGDFEYLLLMAQVMAELGLARSEFILVRKSALSELPRLLEILDAIPGREQRVPSLCDYLGRAANREEERLEEQDLQALPAALRDGIGRDHYRTEASWMQAILADELPPKSKLIYVIGVRDNNADYLENEACEEILRTWRERDDQRRASGPSLAQVAEQYGDPTGRRLYALRDLEWKWFGRAYAERGAEASQQWLDPSPPMMRLE